MHLNGKGFQAVVAENIFDTRGLVMKTHKVISCGTVAPGELLKEWRESGGNRCSLRVIQISRGSGTCINSFACRAWKEKVIQYQEPPGPRGNVWISRGNE
jgi:hypothetical protein